MKFTTLLKTMALGLLFSFGIQITSVLADDDTEGTIGIEEPTTTNENPGSDTE